MALRNVEHQNFKSNFIIQEYEMFKWDIYKCVKALVLYKVKKVTVRNFCTHFASDSTVVFFFFFLLNPYFAVSKTKTKGQEILVRL